MKKVSIVIPTFNQADYLPACVDHCLYQTYPYLEIIIVDGGSGDGTKAYLAGLKEEIANQTCRPVVEMDSDGNLIRRESPTYPSNRELKIVTFPGDIGPTRTYNEGLGRVTGKYCTYVVGDDLPHPHMIEALVAGLESTGVDFVYSDMNVVDDAGRIVRQIRLPDYDFEACLAKWYFLGVSHLYQTTWHQRIGLMDEAYQSANDYDHYLRFAMAGAKFHHLPQVLYSVRFHGPDRKEGQHTPQRDRNLIIESKKCAYRARQWLLAYNSANQQGQT
jgi:glycosyltransferase involved in cell wall biosynthesis